MKTNIYLNKNHLGIILIIMFWFVGLNSLKAQYWFPFVKSNGASNQMFGYDNLNTHNLGIGINNIVPLAKFHILESISTTLPLFRAQVPGVGSLMTWIDTSSAYYGIYEFSYAGTQLPVLNYFQDPVLFGNMSINGLNTNQIYITTRVSSSVINFDFGTHTPGTNPTPLKIYQDSIRVTGKAAMDSFELYNNHGLGYILTSDAHGNGTWTDPSGVNFNDRKWMINDDGDLYSYPSRNHVGIGFQNSTDKILQKMHIVNGNILLSRSEGTTLSDGNGSILFGDSTTNIDCPMGIWGIDYYRGGLNFWKNYCTPSKKDGGNQSPGFDYGLFLKDDGTVGLGTNQTFGYKLAIKGNVICEELKVKLSQNWPDYVLKDDYKLLPLKDVEKYITKNQHLPDIPSAKDVRANGVNVGEMNAVLVKKIEELTKYLIEQERRIDELTKRVSSLNENMLVK